MTDSWWRLGEGSGFDGDDLALHRITCAFCGERGNFARAFHETKKKPTSRKQLNFDVYKCGNCAGFVHVLWSANEYRGSRGFHDFKVLPWPLDKPQPSENWPEAIQRFWIQASDSLAGENWDAATLMARAALQTALREKGAQGKNLKGEIDDLAAKAILPPLMKDWSDEIRLLGNDSAHPGPKAPATDPADAKDILHFLDLLLLYLFDFPKHVDEYRQRSSTPKP